MVVDFLPVLKHREEVKSTRDAERHPYFYSKTLVNTEKMLESPDFACTLKETKTTIPISRTPKPISGFGLKPGHPQLGWPHRRHADHRPERLDDRRVHVRRLGHQPGRERRQVRAGSQVDGERHAHPVRAVDARPGQPHLRRQRGDRRQDRPADWQDRREDQRARQRIHPRRLHVRHVEHSGRLQGQCSET